MLVAVLKQIFLHKPDLDERLAERNFAPSRAQVLSDRMRGKSRSLSAAEISEPFVEKRLFSSLRAANDQAKYPKGNVRKQHVLEIYYSPFLVALRTQINSRRLADAPYNRCTYASF